MSQNACPGQPHLLLNQATKPYRWQSILNEICKLSGICAALILILTLAGFAARLNYFCEIICHFRVQYAVCSLLLLLPLLLARRFACAGLAALALAINLALIIPLYGSVRSLGIKYADNALVVAEINVNTANQQKDKLVAFLRESCPDIAAVLEVDSKWAVCLDEVKDLYPYRKIVRRDDNFGIALISRLPMENVRVVQIGNAGVESLWAEFKSEKWRLGVLATHPIPPFGPRGLQLRNNQLAEIPAFLAEKRMPAILLGDLNTTMWSPYYADLLKGAGLRCNRGGVLATWPSIWPLLYVPLDHILGNMETEMEACWVGGDIGSDHFPILARMRIAETVAEAPDGSTFAIDKSLNMVQP